MAIIDFSTINEYTNKRWARGLINEAMSGSYFQKIMGGENSDIIIDVEKDAKLNPDVVNQVERVLKRAKVLLEKEGKQTKVTSIKILKNGDIEMSFNEPPKKVKKEDGVRKLLF